METAARRFVGWILLVHLLLLAVVVATIVLASREIYESARDQAIDQARRRQELLAGQTARGVETFYKSILSNLDLLCRGEGSTAGNALSGITPGGATDRETILAPMLWHQLQGRISNLFSLDRSTLRVIHSYGDHQLVTDEAIVASAGQWLGEVKAAAVSPFVSIGEAGEGVTLVAMPVAGTQGQLMVIAVPTRVIRTEFLSDVNNQRSMSALLLDENARILVGFESRLVGKKILDEVVDPRINEVAVKYLQQGKPGTEVFEQPVKVADTTYSSAMTTMYPIDQPEKKWWLVLSSSFAEIDDVVRTLFRRALIWGGFVIVSVTAILVSTSIQLIRGRLRLERVQHEMITKELTQAREIQLAWLPRQKVIGSVDIAAVNQPASHISGDFYNWFDLPDGRTVVTVGDVTGHGIAAAFLMATTQLLVRTTMLRVGDPGQCLDEVNRQLCVQVFNGQFVTMLVLVIDTERNTLELATAGHQPPLLGTGGAFEPLRVTPQLVLGVDDDVTFPTERFALSPQSTLLLYTDGAVDVQSPAGERFSTDRLVSSLYGRFRSAEAVIDAALDAVNEFRGGRDLGDDLTFVAIQLQSTPVETSEIAAAG